MIPSSRQKSGHARLRMRTFEPTGWNDKIVVLKKTALQLYFRTFFEKINSDNLIML